MVIMMRMVRTQISLTEEQMEALRDVAFRRRLPLAELMRQAVDRLLSEDRQGHQLQRALNAVRQGGAKAGPANIARDHDAYLVDDFE